MKTRIYRITIDVADQRVTRLIEAPNPAQAARKATESIITVDIPTTAEACLLVAKGIPVETI